MVYNLVTFKDIELHVLFNTDRGYAYTYIYCSKRHWRDSTTSLYLDFTKTKFTHTNTHTPGLWLVSIAIKEAIGCLQIVCQVVNL